MSKKHISVIDLVGNYESGPVIKDKKPNHVISYSEDGEQADDPMAPGKGFTKRKKRLKKEALGLFDVPYGSTITNISHRQRDSYEEQDKEVAQRFFGGESNIDSEESGPPANIDRVDKKEPINILEENEINDFFSFLRIKPKAKHKKLGEKMNQDHLELNKLASALRAKGFDAQANSVLSLTKSANAMPADQYIAFNAWMEKVRQKAEENPSWGAAGRSVYGIDEKILDSAVIQDLSNAAKARYFANYTDYTKALGGKDKESLKKAIDLIDEAFKMADQTDESGYEPQAYYLGKARNWIGFSTMRLKGNAPIFWAFAHDVASDEAAAFYSVESSTKENLKKQLESAKSKYRKTVSGGFKWISDKELEFSRQNITERGQAIEEVHHWSSENEGQDYDNPPCIDDTADCPTKFGIDPVSHPEFSKFFKFKKYRKIKEGKVFGEIEKFAGTRPSPPPEKGKYNLVNAKDKSKGWVATDKDGNTKKFTKEEDAKAHAEKGKSSKSKTPVRRLTPMAQLTSNHITDTKSGNEFRKWVNETHPRVAGKHDLDPENNRSNGWYNSNIRNAWRDVGKQYIADKTKEQGSAGMTGPSGSQLAKQVSDATLISYMMLPKDSQLAGARNSDSNLSRVFLEKYFNATGQPTANAEAMIKRMLRNAAYSKVIRKAYDADLKATPDLEDKIQISAFNRQEAANQAEEDKRKREEQEKAKASGRVNLKDFIIIPEGGTGSTRDTSGNYKLGTILVGANAPYRGKTYFVGKQGDVVGLFPLSLRASSGYGVTPGTNVLTDEEQAAVIREAKTSHPQHAKTYEKLMDLDREIMEALADPDGPWYRSETAHKDLIRKYREKRIGLVKELGGNVVVDANKIKDPTLRVNPETLT